MKNSQRFPIGVWVSPPPQFINRVEYQKIKEAGINLLYPNYETKMDKEVFRALEIAEEFDLDYFVNDKRYGKGEISFEEAEKNIQEYRKYKSFAGINAFDEPFYKHFENLGEAKKRYEFLLENELFYINLLPIYAPSFAISESLSKDESTTNEYEKYLDCYLEKVKPEIISVDFYPFRWEEGKCDARYFEQISLIKKYADKINVNFWTFIQITSWKKNEIRNTTKAEIFWQVATAIAYGVKGIQYFTYWTPNDDEKEIFDKAMVDENGNIMPSYYYVKEINAHINLIGEILLNCKSVGLMSKNNLESKIPESDLIYDFGNILNCNSEEILIGCFIYKENFAYYLVNTNVLKTIDIEINFKKRIDVNIYTTKEIKLNAINKLNITLEKGEGILLVESRN